MVGVVDLYGSRVVALERVSVENTAEICRVLQAAFQREGTPDRLLSDNGPQFTSEAFGHFLARSGVVHTRTKPWHPWTNGRIERLFRTFKETIFGLVWFVRGMKQLDRFCSDFCTLYNRADHAQLVGRANA